MRRRFNHTGRKRIEQSSCSISLDMEGGMQRFRAHIDLAGLSLPNDARVYVEAYVKNSTMRFDFGTVLHLKNGEAHELGELDASGSVLFRVRVVDESERIGRILAAANRLRPSGDEGKAGRRSILPVRSADLGSQVWKVEVDPDDGPMLSVSNRVPSLKEELIANPVYAALILPHVLRVIVASIVARGAIDSQDWAADWVTWVHRECGIDLAVQIDNEVLSEDIEDDVAEAFSARHALLERMMTSMEVQ